MFPQGRKTFPLVLHYGSQKPIAIATHRILEVVIQKECSPSLHFPCTSKSSIPGRKVSALPLSCHVTSLCVEGTILYSWTFNHVSLPLVGPKQLERSPVPQISKSLPESCWCWHKICVTYHHRLQLIDEVSGCILIAQLRSMNSMCPISYPQLVTAVYTNVNTNWIL